MTSQEFKTAKISMEKVDYPFGTYAYYDATTDSYYNNFGQLLRDPSEYGADEDGCYTPFGDE
jgi:hypothetical protein